MKEAGYLKFSFATFTGVATKLLGGSYRFVVVLIVLICVDTIFGWIKAWKNKTFTSGQARLGAMGKIVELMLIGCLYLLDWVFMTDVLKYIGIYYFMICEGTSILENYAQINGNLPEGTVELLELLRDNFSKKILLYFKNLFGNK